MEEMIAYLFVFFGNINRWWEQNSFVTMWSEKLVIFTMFSNLKKETHDNLRIINLIIYNENIIVIITQ